MTNIENERPVEEKFGLKVVLAENVFNLHFV
jgi:hypothetical protein